MPQSTENSEICVLVPLLLYSISFGTSIIIITIGRRMVVRLHFDETLVWYDRIDITDEETEDIGGC